MYIFQMETTHNTIEVHNFESEKCVYFTKTERNKAIHQ